MTTSDWDKVDSELEAIIDAAESMLVSSDENDLMEALRDIHRSLGRIKTIMNGLERD